MPIPIEQFGRDHWSTFAYIETRITDHSGVLRKEHMRCDPVRHPGHAHLRDPAPPTRLRDNKKQEDHDDWDCADDLEAAGLLVINGTGLHPVFRLTQEGVRIASQLREHKAADKSFATFVPTPCPTTSTAT